MTKSIIELYELLLSEGTLNNLESDILERELDTCYREKRVKIKDEETDKKVIEKIRIAKKGVGIKDEINAYEKKMKHLSLDATVIENLVYKFNHSNVSNSDLPILDKILYKNRISKKIYMVTLIVIILLLVLSLISMIQ